jgi:hypothetical protein
MGTVMIVFVPVRLSCSTKRSAVEPSGNERPSVGSGFGMFSKYQSLPVLLTSICQL